MKIHTWDRLDDSAAINSPNPVETDAEVHDVMVPHRPPTLESDFLVPFMQATMTGLVIGTATATLLWACVGSPFFKSCAVSVTVGVALAWLWRLAANHATLWTTHRYVGSVGGDDLKGMPLNRLSPISWLSTLMRGGKRSAKRKRSVCAPSLRASSAAQ